MLSRKEVLGYETMARIFKVRLSYTIKHTACLLVIDLGLE